MNKWIGMGRLTRDPEIRVSQGAEPMTVASFTMAIDRKYAKNDSENKADFIRIVVFGKKAEFCEKYLKQGSKVVVEGRIQTGSYTNKEGQKVYTTDIIAEDIEFAESKKANGEQGPKQEEGPASDGFINVPEGIENDLPFK